MQIQDTGLEMCEVSTMRQSTSEAKQSGGSGRPSSRAHLVDNGALHRFDGDGRLVDTQNAGALARGRAHAAGELGEIVREEEPLQSVPPAPLIHQRIPLRNQVAQRTPYKVWRTICTIVLSP